MPKRNPVIKSYKLKNGSERWGFRIYLGVNPHTHKKANTRLTSFISYQQAAAEYSRISYLVKNDLWKWPTDDQSKTFEEVYKTWYKSYKQGVKRSTLAKTEDLFNLHILPALGIKKIDKITVADCQQAVDLWAATYVKYKALCNYTSDIFQQAKRNEQIENNPMELVIVPKQGKTSDRTADNFLTTDELKMFMNFVKEHKNQEIYTFFRLLAFSGMRKGEELALTWGDIDLDNNRLDINKTLAKQHNKNIINPPKWGSYRNIDLDQRTLDVLREWKATFKRPTNTTLVFPNRNNKHRQLLDPNTWLDKIIEQMNRGKDKPVIHRITPHGFRHTHATLLFETNENIKPKEVQERLGHKNIGITLNIYTHVTENERRQISKSLSDKIDF